MTFTELGDGEFRHYSTEKFLTCVKEISQYISVYLSISLDLQTQAVGIYGSVWMMTAECSDSAVMMRTLKN